MKKTILFSAFALFFALAPHVFAEGFVPLAPIPGLTKDVVADSAGLASFFNNLYKYLIGLAAVLAVIQITWAGLEIAVNKEDVSKITDSKGKIYNAVFGLILVLSPVLVFSIINPAILNLSLNLPALDTKSGANIGGSTKTPVASIDSFTKCSVAGIGGFLETATCPSDSAASTWASSYCSGQLRTPSSCATKDPNTGVCTSSVISCEYQSPPIMFINTTNATFSYNLRPINSDMAAKFQQFQTGCNNSGGVLCTNGLKTMPSTNCGNYNSGGFTPGASIPGGASATCYYTPVMCFSQTDAATARSYVINPLKFSTANLYSCTPDIVFTPQAVQ